MNTSTKLTTDDMRKLYTTFSKLYVDTKLFYVLIGYLVQASYAGFSNFRGHMWLTGVSGCGKSTILANFLHKLGRGLTLLISNSTSAGILQTMNPNDGSSSSPVIFYDEAAGDTSYKKRINQSNNTIFREMATSNDDALSLRGQADHEAKQFNNKASVFRASTVSDLQDWQDIARTFQIDLTDKLKDRLVIDKLAEVSSELNEAWLMMLINQAPNYNKFQKLALTILEEMHTKEGLSDLSHKTILCSTLAGGLACVFKHTEDLADEKCVQKAITLLKSKFVEDAETQKEFKENEGDIVSKIFEIQKTEGIHSMPFMEFLTNSMNMSPQRIYQLYGVTTNVEANEVRILQTGYKFHNLVEDKNLVQKQIIDSHTKLKEASKIKGSGIVTTPCWCPHSKVTKRFYIIKVPKEYQVSNMYNQQLKEVKN